ncbi:hypothetical protein, conserved [Eimeria tenella]|uniref:AAR2 protein n=1 Tax=Eimeria tenella TaxID=5802 RepID=U6KVH0_EIMTE|nr:hypothetical protein, conserved [Eimeria tenella]CDJ41951.1 hypothetical protein, conserved [Eimeria tenella]|eukprot:XP_013232701.1 hypothetical protein, conserved [Eimeria tenella]
MQVKSRSEGEAEKKRSSACSGMETPEEELFPRVTAASLSSGCTLLLLRTPQQLLLGLDLAQWRVGPNFKGVRNIDFGCHFLHWAAAAPPAAAAAAAAPAAAAAAARCTYTQMRVEEALGSTGQRGEFLHFSAAQRTIVREWSSSLGRFLPLEAAAAAAAAAAADRLEFLPHLGLYPSFLRPKWRALAAHISAAAQRQQRRRARRGAEGKRGDGEGSGDAAAAPGQAAAADAAAADAAAADAAAAAAAGGEEEAARERREAAEAASCRMFYMDVRPARSAAVAAARCAAAAARRTGLDAAAAAAAAAAAVTAQCTDRSDALLLLIREHQEGFAAVLAELQMAFIAVVLGHHYPSLVHWKDLLQLVCNSERALYLYPELFSKFIDTFYAQLEQAPDELTELEPLQQNNLLTSCCAALLEFCCSVDRQAARAALKQQQVEAAAAATPAAAAAGKAAPTRRREVHDRHPDAMQTEQTQQQPPAAAEATAPAAEAAAAAQAAAAEAEIDRAVAARLAALEPQYKEVEAAAKRLCDLVRILFKTDEKRKGEMKNFSEMEQVLLALQGDEGPVVVGWTEDAADSSSNNNNNCDNNDNNNNNNGDNNGNNEDSSGKKDANLNSCDAGDSAEAEGKMQTDA